VSRWRGGLPSASSLPSAASAASASASYSSSSGYGSGSNCSDLVHCDSKTPLRLLDLQRRQQQRTCTGSDDVRRTVMSQRNTFPTPGSAGDSQLQPSVKYELNSSLLVGSRHSFVLTYFSRSK